MKIQMLEVDNNLNYNLHQNVNENTNAQTSYCTGPNSTFIPTVNNKIHILSIISIIIIIVD